MILQKLKYNMKRRCIYSYEFSDNSVYVGLTWNLNARNYRHMNDVESTVNEKMVICKNFKLCQLTEFVEPNEAKKYDKCL